MKRATNEILVREDRSQLRTPRSRVLRRLLRMSAMATGAALGLAQLGGVVLAAGRDARALDRAELLPTGGQISTVELRTQLSTPTVGSELLAIGWSDPRAYGSNGNGKGGQG